jgi:hypothetical protein
VPTARRAALVRGHWALDAAIALTKHARTRRIRVEDIRALSQTAASAVS